MARTPRRNINQPQIPSPSLPSYYGQPFPNGKSQNSLSNEKTPILDQQIESTAGGGSPTAANGDNKLRSLVLALLGDSSYQSQFLGAIGQTGSSDDAYLMQLLQIASGNLNKIGTDDDDLQAKLVDMLLTNLQKKEQRTYDENALQEQRLYDSPTNQLASLMATGMSRDAAIQALQGATDPALVGSGSGEDAGSHTPPSQSLLNALQTSLGFISAVGNLVGLGFSAAQAVQQVHYLKNANFISDSQNKAYVSAGKAYSILSAAGSAAESFDSVGSAVKAISSLAAGGDKLATQFVAQGGLADLEMNAPFASGVLRDMYKSEHGSEMFRKELRRAELQNELTNANIETEYQNIMESLQNILESDERIKEIRQNVLMKKAITRQEEYAADFADFQGDVLEGLRNTKDSEGRSAAELMSSSQFLEIWRHFQESVAQTQDHEKFRKYLEDNWNAAADLATINALAAKNYRAQFGEDQGEMTWMSTILRFHRLMADSGMIEDLRAVGAVGGQILVNFLNPAKRP